jgi:hypothetical protein
MPPPVCMLCGERTGYGLFKRTALICTSAECKTAANAAAAAHGVLAPQPGLICCHSCADGMLMKDCPRCGSSLKHY